MKRDIDLVMKSSHYVIEGSIKVEALYIACVTNGQGGW